MSDDAPEADRLPGAPHPRETARLFGQAAAEAAFEAAAAGGRLHHGWLLTGPRGVGKATLAYRIAAALLSGEGASLDVDPAAPALRRIRAGTEPGLLTLRREWDAKAGRMRQSIGVDQIRGTEGSRSAPGTRGIAPFLQLSAPGGGRRVVIVDAADEMTVEAANALLKLLEEPPARTVLLLVAHRPWRLLPTIRSRCRELRLTPLGPEDLAAALAQAGAEAGPAEALAALSGGSAGEAIRLSSGGGTELYAELLRLLSRAPGMDRGAMLALAEGAAGRGREERLDLLLHLTEALLARLARTGAAGAPVPEAAPGEATILARLSPSPAAARLWAGAQSAVARARAGAAVNLDPAALVLDMLAEIDETAARAVALQGAA